MADELKGIAALIIVIGGFLSIVFFGDRYVEKQKKKYHVEWVKKYDIVSLDRSNNISGTFFLGSGTIKEKTYYEVYEVDPGGNYKLSRLDASYTLIYESSAISPQVQVLYRVRTSDGKRDDEPIFMSRKRLVVPKNTIQKNSFFLIRKYHVQQETKQAVEEE